MSCGRCGKSLGRREQYKENAQCCSLGSLTRQHALSLYSRFLMRFVHLGESFSFYLKRWLIFLFFCSVEISCSRWWLFGATLAESKWRECPQVIWSATRAPRAIHICGLGSPIFFVPAIWKRTLLMEHSFWIWKIVSFLSNLISSH